MIKHFLIISIFIVTMVWALKTYIQVCSNCMNIKSDAVYFNCIHQETKLDFLIRFLQTYTAGNEWIYFTLIFVWINILAQLLIPVVLRNPSFVDVFYIFFVVPCCFYFQFFTKINTMIAYKHYIMQSIQEQICFPKNNLVLLVCN